MMKIYLSFFLLLDREPCVCDGFFVFDQIIKRPTSSISANMFAQTWLTDVIHFSIVIEKIENIIDIVQRLLDVDLMLGQRRTR